METVDILLTNARVLTMNAAYSQYSPGAVAIRGDSIAAVGPEAEVLSQYSAPVREDCRGRIVMPGLVNAHTHVPMTLLRGLADDLRLDVWLMGYMMPVERAFVSPDFVRLGTQIACAEMIRGGVTCFADMYYYEEDVARATTAAGMRAVCGQTIIKFPTPDAQSFEESLAYTRDFIQRWINHPLIVPAVAPHAAYTNTDEILQACAALALEFDVPLHTHIAETELEVTSLRNQIGMPVVPYMKKQSILDTKLIAAHCVWVDEGEMRTFQKHNSGVSHNPSSNLKLASGVAPVARMMELGINVGIGTDGPASNNDLDMFEEVRLASFLAKSATGNPTVLPAHLALAMATRIGAQALHQGHITGSLEPGKRADLIVLDIHPIHNQPAFRRDPIAIYSQVVYAAHSSDVISTMVNGRWLMKDHQLLTLDEEDMILESQDYARKIDHFLVQRENSVLSKLIAIGGAYEEESFEVQAKVSLADPQLVLEALKKPEVKILRKRHYREYDTYFSFPEPEKDHLRYREDHFINEGGETTNTRSRLTLIRMAREHHFPQGVLLSRSRYIAPANQSLRFYREYFKPDLELEIEKDRLRFLVEYKNTEFFVNVDTVTKPSLGAYLEIKSRTWSRRDAERKSRMVVELITYLGADPAGIVSQDYIEMVPQTWA